jgi:hypothetical protein
MVYSESRSGVALPVPVEISDMQLKLYRCLGPELSIDKPESLRLGVVSPFVFAPTPKILGTLMALLEKVLLRGIRVSFYFKRSMA